MNDEQYFLIQNSDGDTLISAYTQTELQRALTEEKFTSFLPEIPALDTSYWDNQPLIIKGRIIVPRAVQVATEYEVD